jgi:putative hydrolase of the HAD superfamily
MLGVSAESLMSISLIAFDADDTLWHNESHFHLSQERFCDLLGERVPAEQLMASLVATERRNLKRYGYGVKGFTLSLIETALEVTGGDVPAKAIGEILSIGKDLLDHPVEPLPGVHETLQALGPYVTLVLITKGDLLHQEQKLAASGLAELFDGIEIVSEKDSDTYRRIFTRHGVDPEHAVMVGNSLKSDVIPALDVGADGIWVPYHITWELERVETPPVHPRFAKFDTIREVVPWFARRTGQAVADLFRG